MGKILLIEDDGLLTRDLRKSLEEELNHEVTVAYSYSTAIALWKKFDGMFDCIILDMNINPHGLDDKERDLYFPISGILVLKEICKDISKEEEQEKIWSKTIIYSAYIDVLKAKKDDFKYYHCLTLIPKIAENIYNISDSVIKIVNY